MDVAFLLFWTMLRYNTSKWRFSFGHHIKSISVLLFVDTSPFKHFSFVFVGNKSHDYLCPKECQIFYISLVNRHTLKLQQLSCFSGPLSQQTMHLRSKMKWLIKVVFLFILDKDLHWLTTSLWFLRQQPTFLYFLANKQNSKQSNFRRHQKNKNVIWDQIFCLLNHFFHFVRRNRYLEGCIVDKPSD